MLVVWDSGKTNEAEIGRNGRILSSLAKAGANCGLRPASSRSHSAEQPQSFEPTMPHPHQPNHIHASQLHPNGARAWFPWFPPKGKVVATPLGVVRVEWSGFSEPAELILAVYHSPL